MNEVLDVRSDVWRALRAHQRQLAKVPTRRLFETDAQRFEQLSWRLDGMLVDCSKHRITAQTLSMLRALARQAELEAQRDALFAGETVNRSEQRAAMHMALRNTSARPMHVEGRDVMPEVRQVRQQMQQFEHALRSGAWRGGSGERITDVVHLGIGGSDLGPRLVCEALVACRLPELRVHFVANVDGAELHALLPSLNPARTLFTVASKSFTTQETLANALEAKRWCMQSGSIQLWQQHFVALSANLAEVQRFGLDAATHCFRLWDWVGGRTSLWSAIGLPIVLALGFGNFEGLLRGAHSVDEHVRLSALEDNVPYTLALLAVWYRNFWQAATHAVIPYDQRLASLPSFLQQCEMESNGKRVRQDGSPVPYATAPVLWGSTGTNAQHSFFQLWHQGTQLIPGDFIAAVHGDDPYPEQHRALLAHCIAQTEALMLGRSLDEALRAAKREGSSLQQRRLLAKQRQMPGSQPTTTMLFDRLTPEVLGSLLAMYEHKTFAAGAIWGINSFDQWGVELGKQLAAGVERGLRSSAPCHDHDASTCGLIEYCKTLHPTR